MISKEDMEKLYMRLHVQDATWKILHKHAGSHHYNIANQLGITIDILRGFEYLEYDALFKRLCKLYVRI